MVPPWRPARKQVRRRPDTSGAYPDRPVARASRRCGNRSLIFAPWPRAPCGRRFAAGLSHRTADHAAESRHPTAAVQPPAAGPRGPAARAAPEQIHHQNRQRQKQQKHGPDYPARRRSASASGLAHRFDRQDRRQVAQDLGPAFALVRAGEDAAGIGAEIDAGRRGRVVVLVFPPSSVTKTPAPKNSPPPPAQMRPVSGSPSLRNTGPSQSIRRDHHCWPARRLSSCRSSPWSASPHL